MQKNSKINKNVVEFNQFVLKQEIDKMPIGLYYGKMGLCIYFYHQYRYFGDKAYKRFAEKLLDSICDSVSEDSSINFESGLTGICWGIIYLIENKFIKGNPNHILKEFDDKILRDFPSMFLKNVIVNKESLLSMLFYFCKRLNDEKLPKDEKYLFENYIIRGINLIETISPNECLQEVQHFSFFDYFLPRYLELLHRIYHMNFYNYKIDKIFDQLSLGVRSRYPLISSNRLYLSCEMKKIATLKNIPGWVEHIGVLEQSVDLKVIIEEFRNKNISLENGLAGFYYLLRQFGLNTENINNLVVEKIADSELWKIIYQPEELKKQMSLMNGISGIILMYQDIVN